MSHSPLIIYSLLMTNYLLLATCYLQLATHAAYLTSHSSHPTLYTSPACTSDYECMHNTTIHDLLATHYALKCPASHASHLSRRLTKSLYLCITPHLACLRTAAVFGEPSGRAYARGLRQTTVLWHDKLPRRRDGFHSLSAHGHCHTAARDVSLNCHQQQWTSCSGAQWFRCLYLQNYTRCPAKVLSKGT